MEATDQTVHGMLNPKWLDPNQIPTIIEHVNFIQGFHNNLANANNCEAIFY